MKQFTLSVETVSQYSHVVTGALCVLGPVAFFGPAALLPGMALTITFAAIKETFIDPWVETPATAGSGLLDFTFWLLGILLAGVTYAFWHR